jgi:GNAT superfamily N-acetyltransferase
MATIHDLAQLAELRWDFRNEDGTEQAVVDREEFLRTCRGFLMQGLEAGYHTYWIAEEAGEIVSQIFVHRIDMVPRPCKLRDLFGYITNNYTKPVYRRLGIGSELMRRVKQWAQDEDMELLLVHPSKEAVPFYERAGFSSENDVMELILRAYYSPPDS